MAMTIEEMKQHKSRCENGINALLRQFTDATGCRVNSVYCNEIDVTTMDSKGKDVIYNVKIDVAL